MQCGMMGDWRRNNNKNKWGFNPSHGDAFNLTAFQCRFTGVRGSLNYIPVVPHKAVAEVSKIGNL